MNVSKENELQENTHKRQLISYLEPADLKKFCHIPHYIIKEFRRFCKINDIIFSSLITKVLSYFLYLLLEESIGF